MARALTSVQGANRNDITYITASCCVMPLVCVGALFQSILLTGLGFVKGAIVAIPVALLTVASWMISTLLHWPRAIVVTYATVGVTQRLGSNLRALALLLLLVPLVAWPLVTALASCMFSVGVGFFWPMWSTIALGSLWEGSKLFTIALVEPLDLAKACALEVWKFHGVMYFSYLDELRQPYYGEPLDVSFVRLLIAVVLSVLCSLINMLAVGVLGMLRLPFIVARSLGEWMALLSKSSLKLLGLWLPVWLLGIPLIPVVVMCLFLLLLLGNTVYIGPTCGMAAYLATTSRPAHRSLTSAVITAMDVLYKHIHAMDKAAVRLMGLGSSSLLPMPGFWHNGPYTGTGAHGTQAPGSTVGEAEPSASPTTPQDQAWSTFEDICGVSLERVVRWGWMPQSDLLDSEAYLFIGLPALALLQLLADAAAIQSDWMPVTVSADGDVAGDLDGRSDPAEASAVGGEEKEVIRHGGGGGADVEQQQQGSLEGVPIYLAGGAPVPPEGDGGDAHDGSSRGAVEEVVCGLVEVARQPAREEGPQTGALTRALVRESGILTLVEGDGDAHGDGPDGGSVIIHHGGSNEGDDDADHVGDDQHDYDDVAEGADEADVVLHHPRSQTSSFQGAAADPILANDAFDLEPARVVHLDSRRSAVVSSSAVMTRATLPQPPTSTGSASTAAPMNGRIAATQLSVAPYEVDTTPNNNNNNRSPAMPPSSSAPALSAAALQGSSAAAAVESSGSNVGIDGCVTLALGEEPLDPAVAHLLLEDLAEHVLSSDIGFTLAANPVRLYRSLAALQASPLEMRYMTCHTVLLGDPRVTQLVPLHNTTTIIAAAVASGVTATPAPGDRPTVSHGRPSPAAAAVAADSTPTTVVVEGGPRHKDHPSSRDMPNGVTIQSASRWPARWSLNGGSGGGVLAASTSYSRPPSGGGTVMSTTPVTHIDSAANAIRLASMFSPEGGTSATSVAAGISSAPSSPYLSVIVHGDEESAAVKPAAALGAAGCPPRPTDAVTAPGAVPKREELPTLGGFPHTREATVVEASSSNAAPSVVMNEGAGPVVPDDGGQCSSRQLHLMHLASAIPAVIAHVTAAAVESIGGGLSGGPTTAITMAESCGQSGHLAQATPVPTMTLCPLGLNGTAAGGQSAAATAAPMRSQHPLGGSRWPFGRGHRRTRSQPVGMPMGGHVLGAGGLLVPPSPMSVPGASDGAAKEVTPAALSSTRPGTKPMTTSGQGYKSRRPVEAGVSAGVEPGVTVPQSPALAPDPAVAAAATAAAAGALLVTPQRLAQLHAFTAAVQSVATALSKKQRMKEIMGRLLVKYGTSGSVCGDDAGNGGVVRGSTAAGNSVRSQGASD